MGKPLASIPYNKYFDGFSERQITDDRGNPKIIRVYTAEYMMTDMSKRRYTLYKLLSTLLFCFAEALFFIAGIIKIEANEYKPVIFFDCVALVAIIMCLTCMPSKLKRGRKLMRRDYRIISVNFPKFLKVLYLAELSACVVIILYSAVMHQGIASYICASIYAFSSAAFCILRNIEKNVAYVKCANTVKCDDAEVEISY